MKSLSVGRRGLLKAGVTGVGVATSAAFAVACGSGRNDPNSRDAGTFSLDRSHKLLGADEIRESAIGNTLVGEVYDGEGFELYLKSDGVAHLRMQLGRVEAGTWDLRPEGEIVSQWPTIANGERLEHRYYQHPGSGMYKGLAGLRWCTFRIEQGDSRGLDL